MNVHHASKLMALICLLACLLVSCTTSTEESPPPQVSGTPDPTLEAGIAGGWEGDNGSFYIFHADGTWNWDDKRASVENSPENTGSWYMVDDVIYITDLTGPGKCPLSQVGSYQVHFESEILVLTLVEDRCGVRARGTAGRYSPLVASP